ncbi:MAG: methyltransferase domain-containing protein, partial [Lachnospiraceae bacterium]|nr:methyltransferase domain-containing protein [Lachnospiraceae bacterium]
QIYRGEGILSNIALTTNRNHKHIVLEQLGNLKKKEFGAGVLVQTKFPSELLEIRCFEEMFFVLPKTGRVSADPAEAARALAAGGLAEYLAERHEENGRPFLFRIEVRGSMPLDRRGVFVRRLAAALEEETAGRLANAVNGYEVELRLVESSEGGYNVLLKLFTLRDFRFAYRQQTVSTGMRPANAALCMALAGREDFFAPEASVLDPFCGAGTMLIERAKYGKVKEMFGLDILGEAVEAARRNTELAGCRANYVRRDFFTFTREQGFDEVVTDMPFAVSKQPEKQREIEALCRRFFEKMPGLVRDGGRLLLYTHDRAYIRAYAAPAFRILREFEISMKEGSYLVLLEKDVKTERAGSV